MKTFLGRFSIIEGEHEHTAFLLVEAETRAEADRLFQAEEHTVDDYEENGKELTFYNYGDGQTIAEYFECEEVTQEQVEVLRKLDVVYYLNPFEKNIK